MITAPVAQQAAHGPAGTVGGLLVLTLTVWEVAWLAGAASTHPAGWAWRTLTLTWTSARTSGHVPGTSDDVPGQTAVQSHGHDHDDPAPDDTDMSTDPHPALDSAAPLRPVPDLTAPLRPDDETPAPRPASWRGPLPLDELAAATDAALAARDAEWAARGLTPPDRLSDRVRPSARSRADADTRTAGQATADADARTPRRGRATPGDRRAWLAARFDPDTGHPYADTLIEMGVRTTTDVLKVGASALGVTVRHLRRDLTALADQGDSTP